MDLAIAQLLAWTSKHHAVITDQVLRTLNVSVEARKRLVRDGVLERLIDGSYRFTGVPLDELARCVAASARPGGLIVAGPTAGRVDGLRRMPRDNKVHVLAPPASNPSVVPWLVPYRTAAIDPSHVVMRPDGIRITHPARTAVDLMRHLSTSDVRSVVDQILHRGLATMDDMRAVAEPLATPGRRWAKRFLELLDMRGDAAAAESHWESRVIGELRARGLDLVPQHWLDVPSWGRIRLDAALIPLRWGLEIDGHPEHFSEDGSTRDAGRDLACDAIGWSISRVTTLGLQHDFEHQIQTILRVVQRRRRDLAA
jgi:very-short-patch-repair endonuclease